MKIRKEKLLLFLCGLWPGGGYMYLGMMKKGSIAMALFTATAGQTLTVGWKFLAFLLPVIWCYCFFDTFHAYALSTEEREEEDRRCYEWVLAFWREDPLQKLKERRTLAGVLILLASLYTMIYGVLLPFFRWGENFFWVRVVLTVIPTAVMAVLLFMLGKHILQKEQERKAGEEPPAEEPEQERAEEILIRETALAEGEEFSSEERVSS